MTQILTRPMSGPVSTLSRRRLGGAAIGAAAVLVVSFASGSAQSPDDAALAAAIETLREGLFAADKAKLDAATAENMSYGHSAGRIENKAEFIAAVLARKAVVKSLKFTEPKQAISGPSAIARHFYESESEEGGKTTKIKVGVLQVWQKIDGKWKLYARQAHVLPT